MNKKILIVLVVFLLVVVIYYLLVGYNGNKNLYPDNSSNSNNDNQIIQSADTVSISDYAFVPQVLTVTTGTTVTWTNNDSVPHRLTSTNFSSSDLSKGDAYSFTFTSPGTYDYSCAIHPSMTGRVIVQ